MTYKEIDKKVKDFGKGMPISATNEDGEDVIIEGGREPKNNNLRFYQLTTVQKNGWLRINVYWEDGTIEEWFDR